MKRRPGSTRVTGMMAAGLAVILAAGLGFIPLRVAFGHQDGTSTVPEPAAGPASQAAPEPDPQGQMPPGDCGDWPAPATRLAPDGHGGGASRPQGGPPRDEALWKTLGEFYPERVAQIRSLREKDPGRFAQIERQMRPWLRELREARAQNPRLAELMVRQHRNEIAIHQWQARYRNAPDDQRPSLAEDGRKLAATRVELRLQREQMRIQVLEKRLHDLKETLEGREGNKDRLVAQEFEAMSVSNRMHGSRR